jgi:hypothetical protein
MAEERGIRSLSNVGNFDALPPLSKFDVLGHNVPFVPQMKLWPRFYTEELLHHTAADEQALARARRSGKPNDDGR